MFSCSAAIASRLPFFSHTDDDESWFSDEDDSYFEVPSSLVNGTGMERAFSAPKGKECPHFRRSNCLLHFPCCDSSKFYPCHKCHNEAILEEAEQDDKTETTSKQTDLSHATSGEFQACQSELRTAWPSQSENTSVVLEEAAQADTTETTSMQTATSGEFQDSKSELRTAWPSQSENTSDGVLEEAELVDTTEITCMQTATSEGFQDSQSELRTAWPNQSENSIREQSESSMTEVQTALPGQSESTSGVDQSAKRGALETNQCALIDHKTFNHPQATAKIADLVKCTNCHHEQKADYDHCCSCGHKFARYFCSMCKIFVNDPQLDPYHCHKCRVCRPHKSRSFHCDVCNMCMDKRLYRNHKCIENSGHDLCGVCMEEVFSGCIIFPCSHKCHSECARHIIINGRSVNCPICRKPFLDLNAIKNGKPGGLTGYLARFLSRFTSWDG